LGILAADPLPPELTDFFSRVTCVSSGDSVGASVGDSVAVTVSVSVTRVTFSVAVTVVGVAASSPAEHAPSENTTALADTTADTNLTYISQNS
jgi:hypothetical protein